MAVGSRTKLKKRQVDDQIIVGGATGTTSYVAANVNPIPNPLAYATGQKFQIKALATSTGDIDLDVAGIGSKKVFKTPTLQATAGDWIANQWYPLVFEQSIDGGVGAFEMTGGGGSPTGPGTVPNLAAVLIVGNDAGGLPIKNSAAALLGTDLVILSQMNAAIAAAVTGLLDYRGGYDASVNAYPSSGGSGVAGAILKADVFVVIVAGVLPTGKNVRVGDWLIAKVDTPGNTQANWDIIPVSVVLASDTVAGIMKLYQALGGNTDGAVSQAIVTNALNLKADRKFTIIAKVASYTLGAAELAAIATGTSLIMESTTGDLTVPPNATTAFAVGENMGVRGFANIIQGAGVTVIGTNGTLVIPVGRTCILEQKSANNWILHNGSVQVTTWSTAELGIVQESTQAQAENQVTSANISSMVGLSQARANSEISMYYLIKKIFTLSWTWTLQQIFSVGPIVSDATASTVAVFDASKKLVSQTYASLFAQIDATDILNPVAIVSTTLTLDWGTATKKDFDLTAPATAAFAIAFSGANMRRGRLTLRVTGTIPVSLPAACIMDLYEESVGRWVSTTNILTLTGATASPFYMDYEKDSLGNVWVHCTNRGV